jgi:hypothetical protein
MHSGLRVSRINGLRQTFQSVHTGDEDIFQTPFFNSVNTLNQGK